MSNSQYHYGFAVKIENNPVIANSKAVGSYFRMNQFSGVSERLFSVFFEFQCDSTLRSRIDGFQVLHSSLSEDELKHQRVPQSVSFCQLYNRFWLLR